ncbi:diguanylate cyclase DgcJ [Shimwellia blattae]|uniref:diguanylate cyclase n=1 Tax=Shimwellia blattae (strain ATCC 29907 / DSM 4481 / JCM 1650 / NBRC 105725 / CDC 9005-74) TaxID=630626 RepID=I2B6K2_SHIBC|nr:diguanylate cyclase DgcJ [Shimwellia blattae]AFJ46156.1 hypothetical protein EBL_c10460 [Shimwellia blattae DSM 4481 = NBRC 105725]GAB81202.1 putative diguanylate cyclase YeaJ [Shimwellia blattae DSM 4481 = NBRC 105725]VDY63625.1 Diguanylate cyclase DosC [Shimwellia blattae]VEC21686.1 Diguanylate cyclase DosC [Shimwellia blattae]
MQTVLRRTSHTKATVIITALTTLVFSIFIYHELDNLNKYTRYIAENGKSALFHEEYINQKISLHLSHSFSGKDTSTLTPARICQKQERNGDIYGLNLNDHAFQPLPGTLQTKNPNCNDWAGDVPDLLFFNKKIGSISSKYSFSNYTGYLFNNTRYYIDLKKNYIYINKIFDYRKYIFSNWLIKKRNNIDIRTSVHTIDIDENALDDLENGESIVSHIYNDGDTQGNIISLLMPVFSSGDIKGIIITDINISDLTTAFYTHDRPFLWKFITLYVKDNHAGKIIDFHQPSLKIFDVSHYQTSITKYYTLHIGIDMQYFIINNIWIFILYILATCLLCAYTKNHLIRQHLLARESITDAMTGLYNRRIFSSALEKTIASLTGKNIPITTIAIDSDGLKKINDTLGHHMGDYAIEILGQAILHSIRKADYGVRLGGDEFLIILMGNSLPEADAVIRRIIQRLCETDSHNIVKFSYGCYQLAPGDTLEHALRKADELLYQNKRRKNAQRNG